MNLSAFLFSASSRTSIKLSFERSEPRQYQTIAVFNSLLNFEINPKHNGVCQFSDRSAQFVRQFFVPTQEIAGHQRDASLAAARPFREAQVQRDSYDLPEF